MTLPGSLPLPDSWPDRVHGAVVRAIGLAHKSLTYARGWAANSSIARVRLAAENDRLRTEVALLKRELDLLSGRLERVPAKNRPHYLPTERLQILELKAARCWSAAQAARRLLLVPATILAWLQRLDREGEDGLIKTPEPINRFPELVQHVVQSLRAQLPLMGKRRIADR